MPNINLEGGNQVVFDFLPDVCPQCHHAVHPKILIGSLNGDPGKHGTYLEIACKCTHRNCLSIFIGQYKRQLSTGPARGMQGTFNLVRAIPQRYQAPAIFPEVESISPSFKNIYEQACAAESFQLNEISGVGYRKALEFLIKDYCMHKKPDSEEEIKSSLLGAVISKFVEDSNLKACAQRAAWLGNDETHYVRKWETKDIEDLKILIELSCVWVRSCVLTEKYLAEMQ